MKSNSSNSTIDFPNIPILDTSSSPIGFVPGEFCAPPDNGQEFEPFLGSVTMRDMYNSNFSLREFQGHYNRNTLLINKEGMALDYVQVCLFLKGEVRSFLKDKEETFASTNHSQSFKYDPANEYKHFVPANKPFHIAHFSIKPDYFMGLLPEEESGFTIPRTSVSKKNRLIGTRFPAIIAAQLSALQNIYDCPLTGRLGHLMMETSLVQIVLLQMYAQFHENNQKTLKVKKTDLDLAHGVKEHISQNFLNDHSLIDLTRLFGTNKNKLMSLFRQEFGKSIFDYLSDLRMTYAQDMLRQKTTTVSEVAHVIGYKNANHFSVAFKKKYGFSPSQLKH